MSNIIIYWCIDIKYCIHITVLVTNIVIIGCQLYNSVILFEGALLYVNEPDGDLEEGKHGMITNNASCTDTAEDTSGYRSDREDLSEDSFTASVDGNSSTTDKEKTPTLYKKRKGLYNFNAAFKVNTLCVCSYWP